MGAAWKVTQEIICHLHGQTRLADPAGTRDRDQANIPTQ